MTNIHVQKQQHPLEFKLLLNESLLEITIMLSDMKIDSTANSMNQPTSTHIGAMRSGHYGNGLSRELEVSDSGH